MNIGETDKSFYSPGGRKYPDNWYKRKSNYQYKSPSRSRSQNRGPLDRLTKLKFKQTPGILDNPGYSKRTNQVNIMKGRGPHIAREEKKSYSNPLSLHWQYSKNGNEKAAASKLTTPASTPRR